MVSRISVSAGIEVSTRYDDRDFQSSDLVKRFANLDTNINNEISFAANDPIALDKLAEQYLADGMASLADASMGYYFRYCDAYNRVTHIECTCYSYVGCAC